MKDELRYHGDLPARQTHHPQGAPVTTTPPARPGGQPSVTGVIAFLKAAGFRHSRSTEARSSTVGSGASVRPGSKGEVRVRWREGDHDFFTRMRDLGLSDVAEVPDHPEAALRAREYADALTPRYTTRVDGNSLILTRRAELPPRPPGTPRAATVRTALDKAGIRWRPGQYDRFSVVNQPDHTRVTVFDDETVDRVTAVLRAQGWAYNHFETVEHYGIKVTGAEPARPPLPAVVQHAEEPPAPAPLTTRVTWSYLGEDGRPRGLMTFDLPREHEARLTAQGIPPDFDLTATGPGIVTAHTSYGSGHAASGDLAEVAHDCAAWLGIDSGTPLVITVGTDPGMP
jgi:hypothetical protein